MDKTFEILGFEEVIAQLAEHANSFQAKEGLRKLRPYLSEI